MKRAIIIYGSRYGSAKRYAERLSQLTGIESLSFKEVKGIEEYDRIIFIGALYAGSVLGLKGLALKMVDGQELLIATVGMADPTDPENIRNIRNWIKIRIPEKLYSENRIFHLRGAIDYKHLGLKHKVMMSMLYNKLSKMPEEELNAETKAMLATYGGVVDFVDFETLKELSEQTLSPVAR